jgi:hypothetical protein
LFDREHHRRVARVLEALDADLLAGARCFFGGGTAIALRFGEYRESIDVDFLVSEIGGYRALRERMSRGGVAAITRAGATLRQVREVRADQYGVRTMLDVDGVAIKIEIVLEARVSLDTPAATDRVCGVASLTTRDLACEKLLANSDRWPDDSVNSRDVIDLAMMELARPALADAMAKARGAYGDAPARDLVKAIASLKARPGRLEHCMKALKMDLAPAVVWKHIRALAKNSGTGSGR